MKIAEPEMSKERVSKLSSMERAGLQRNKIDGWVKGRGLPDVEIVEQRKLKRTRSVEESPTIEDAPRVRKLIGVECPICGASVVHSRMDDHFDQQHPA